MTLHLTLAAAKRGALLACLALAAMATAAPPASAAPAPVWALSLTSQPSNFVPGKRSEYFLTATNVGGAETTSEPVLIETTVPPQLAIVDVLGVNEDPAAASNPNCTVVSQTVHCETAETLRTDRNLVVEVGVEAPPGAPQETLSAQASISGGGAANQPSAEADTVIGGVPLPFGFLGGLSAPLTEEDGSPTTAAGSHPFQFTVAFGFPSQRAGNVLGNSGHPRDFFNELPRGLLGFPAATPVLCTEAELTTGNAGCPDASQVGVLEILTGITDRAVTQPSNLYSMVPPPGAAAELATSAFGVGLYTHIIAGVRSDGDYGIEATTEDVIALGKDPLLGARVRLWGDPSSPAFDRIRGNCISKNTNPSGDPCPAEEPQSTAFFTLPTDCPGQPLTHRVKADTWEQPGSFVEASYESADLEGNPASVSGCNALSFEPSISSKATTNLAESPSGLDFDLHQPQNTELGNNSTAALKDISVALPEGMTLNPAAANGLEGCSSAQIGLLTGVGQTPIHLSKEPATCPDAAKIGTVKVKTPLLIQRDAEHKLELDPETGRPIPDPLEGSVYLAAPFDNPFGSLLAIYLAIEDKASGVVAKVPGKVSADPNTGQLVTSFSENPELPLEDVEVHIFAGATAPLIAPQSCGAHTTTATARPWSSPEGKDASASDSFQTLASPGGGSCPTSPGAAPPNSPAFKAGTLSPQAGAFSPFVLKLSREDGSQRFSGIETTLPPGLIAKIAGTSKCSEAELAAVKAREVPNQGAAEIRSPSCPASSEIGTVDVGAGAGTPIYVQGHAYLAGPYKGAPLSLATIAPAVAGPFDLGAVLVRVALFVDPVSAKVRAVSDPLPRALEGIPLALRSIALKASRPDFTLNPTSCDPFAIAATATTIPGQSAALSSPFQVGGCSSLGFKPSLAFSLKGGTKRGGHPAFQATYKPRPGDANLKGLVVRLPSSAFLDQAHIRTICTRVQFAAEACPKGAQYGFIKAFTPLLDQPLEGPVYLRSSDHKLPDLVFDLKGQIEVEVAARIDSFHGGIRATITSVPDAPLSKVLLQMQGAKKGLIVNSRDICKGKNRADVQMDAQNGKTRDFTPPLRAKCGKQKKHGRGHGAR